MLGVAVNGDGHAEANMGIAFGDSDDDTLPDIMITHFWGEHDALWRAEETGQLAFIRTRPTRRAWRPTRIS